MEVLLTKRPDGSLVPFDEESKAQLDKLSQGAPLKCKVSRPRNPRFLRKFFALMQVGFDAFDPVAEYKGVVIEKNFKQFREDVTIMAGYYVGTMRPDGTLRLRAKSISFASMDQCDFEALYTAVANVLLQRILTNYTRQNLDEVVNRILGF